MKKPYEIHSDFFKKMIASGWYENREIILDSLPHHLEELPDNVKKFLREIWYLQLVMTLIIVVMDASFYLRYCITLEKPHHGRTQPARRTSVLLRIRPLRHRRQSAQKQQLPR